MKKLWAGRATEQVDAIADDFNSSIRVDSKMFRQDIQGSIAHSAMLAKCGIITPEEGAALSAFVDETQKCVTGEVKLKLYKGNMINAGVTSPYSLYDAEIASFGDDDGVYDQAESAGFINLFGLPIKVQAKVNAKNKK